MDKIQQLEGSVLYFDREIERAKSDKERRYLEDCRADVVREIMKAAGFRTRRRK